MTSNPESVDSTEQYYAHMESDRNAAEAAYFDARPMIDREGTPVTTFRAGFERAYQLLWNDLQSSRRETARACQEYRELNAKYVQGMRATSGETAAERTNHAENLAKALSHYLDAHDTLSGIQSADDATGGSDAVDCGFVDKANDAWRALRTALHEYRKHSPVKTT